MAIERYNSDPISHNLGILKFQDLVNLNSASFVHQLYCNQLYTTTFSSMITRLSKTKIELKNYNNNNDNNNNLSLIHI